MMSARSCPHRCCITSFPCLPARLPARLPPPPPLAGIQATGVCLAQHVLRASEFDGTQATAAQVQHLELAFPSLTRPLTLCVRGVSLTLQQVRLPQVRCGLLHGRKQAEMGK